MKRLLPLLFLSSHLCQKSDKMLLIFILQGTSNQKINGHLNETGDIFFLSVSLLMNGLCYNCQKCLDGSRTNVEVRDQCLK